MTFSASVSVQNGQTQVNYVSGTPWVGLIVPAFLQLDPAAWASDPTKAGDPGKYWIANLDYTGGLWLNLAQPWPGQTGQVAVIIYSDFTPNLGLPLANPGDVNIADLWNRAMQTLDTITPAAPVPLHGPTHVGTGLDPVPLANPTASGALCQTSGNATDYVGGDNQCHPLAGVPTGSVVLWCGQNIPANWLNCDGNQYSRTTYANLYAVLGGSLSPWGQGDGHSTFNTPDLRGRVPMGAGAGKGLSNRLMGQMFGEETHLTTLNEMPAHPHAYVYDNLKPTGGTLGFTTTGTYQLLNAEPASTQSAGGGVAHNNIQPSTVFTFIIRT